MSSIVQTELEMIFAYITTNLAGDWMVTSACSNHLHPVIVAHFEQKWGEVRDPVIRAKLVLSIAGINSRLFRSTDRKMQLAAQKFLAFALTDEDAYVRFIADLLRNIPDDLLLNPDANAANLSAIEKHPAIKATVLRIATALESLKIDFYPDEFAHMSSETINSLTRKEASEFSLVQESKVNVEYALPSREDRLSKYRAAHAKQNEPVDPMSFMKRQKAAPVFLRTTTNVNLKKEAISPAVSTSAKQFFKGAKIKVLDDIAIEQFQAKINKLKWEKDDKKIKLEQEKADKKEARLLALDEKKQLKRERDERRESNIQDMIKQEKEQDREERLSSEPRRHSIPRKQPKISADLGMGSNSPNTNLMFVPATILSSNVEESTMKRPRTFQAESTSSRPSRAALRTTSVDIDQIKSPKLAADSSSRLSIDQITSPSPQDSVTPKKPSKPVISEAEKLEHFGKVIKSTECNTLTLRNKNIIIEFLFRGKLDFGLHFQPGDAGLKEIELNVEFTVDQAGVRSSESLFIILDFVTSKWKKVKRRHSVS